MADFLKDQMDYIFFLYGLAFLMLAVGCFVLRKKEQDLPWLWLGLFGTTHGLYEWLEIINIAVINSNLLQTLSIALKISSFMFLTEFGRAGFCRLRCKGPGRWVFAPLLALAALGLLAGADGIGASSRYSLALTGGLWSSCVLFMYSKGLGPRKRRWLIATGISLGLYTLAAGIIVPYAPFPPASWLNTGSFLQATGLPIQLFRAFFAAAAVLSLWRYSQLPAGDEANAGYGKGKNIFIPVAVLLLILALGWWMTIIAGKHARAEEISEGNLHINAITEFLEDEFQKTKNPAKINSHRIKTSLKKHTNSFVIDPHGIIFMSDRDDMRLKSLWPLTEDDLRAVSASGQFGKGPFIPVLSEKAVGGKYAEMENKRFLVTRQPVGKDGWSVVLLMNTDLIMGYRLFAILTTFVFYSLTITFFAALYFIRESASRISESERLYRSLVEGSPNWVVLFDREGRFLTSNTAGLELIGCDASAIIGKRLDELWTDTKIADIIRRNTQQVLSGAKCAFETAFTRSNGEHLFFSVVLNPIRYAYGQVNSFVGIFVDITARKEAEDKLKAYHEHLGYLVKERTAELTETNRLLNLEMGERMKVEEQLRTSLREKEAMLKEIHHRVKNNLQIICSLLNLQAAQIKDKEALDLFRESQNRVRSMALIHEKLYQTKDLSDISFGDYISSLTTYLYHAYAVRADLIRLKINSDNIFFSITTAIPCGLIVNELVSNCLKHAFPGGREGEITIDLYRSTEGGPADADVFILNVKDNGTGLPEDFDLNNLKSLGLKLVNNLAGQLDGELKQHHSGSGTEFRITFRESKQRSLV